MGVFDSFAESFREVAIGAADRIVESRIAANPNGAAPAGLPYANNTGAKLAAHTGDPSGAVNAPRTGGFQFSQKYALIALAAVVAFAIFYEMKLK